MIEDTMQGSALPATFAADVVRRLFAAIEDCDQATLRTMLNDDARLVFVRDPLRIGFR
jgi:ketosteroid isomerase-like protein